MPNFNKIGEHFGCFLVDFAWNDPLCNQPDTANCSPALKTLYKIIITLFRKMSQSLVLSHTNFISNVGIIKIHTFLFIS